MNDPITTRTKNVIHLGSKVVHVGFMDEYPDGAAKGWPLRARYTHCQRGKVRKTHTYPQEVDEAVTCPSCAAADVDVRVTYE